MRVVKSGFCTVPQLLDGSLSWEDVWIMMDWVELDGYIEGELYAKMEAQAES